MSVVTIAGNILIRAVDLDNNKRYTEALVCYQEGLQLLVDLMKEEKSDSTRVYLRTKIEEYMNRAEKLKNVISNLKEKGQYHEQINIENNSTGHSYEKIFKRFLDFDVNAVSIEDPYIQRHHQCLNLIRLCELLVKNCTNLKIIKLITSEDKSSEQSQCFSEMKQNLKSCNIDFNVTYSSTLHDRQIRLSNGWVIKIGRGLDYFKAPKSKYCLGVNDYDFRPCHETSIDIFHLSSVKETFG